MPFAHVRRETGASNPLGSAAQSAPAVSSGVSDAISAAAAGQPEGPAAAAVELDGLLAAAREEQPGVYSEVRSSCHHASMP